MLEWTDLTADENAVKQSGLSSAALVGTAGCLGLTDTPFSPGRDATTDWPLARHDPGNTAFAPDAVAPRINVRERWSRTSEFDVRTPAIVDGTVFAPAATGLLALDGKSGDELWRFVPTEQPWPSSPTVHNDTVYVTMVDDDTLYAIDAKTGNEQWSLAEAGGIHSPPHLLAGQLVDEPLIVVGSEDGIVRALTPATGEEQWQIDVFGAVRVLAYQRGRLYIGTASGEVYGYYPNGEAKPRELWRRKVGSQIKALVPTDNGVLVSTFGGGLWNLRTGAHAGVTDWVANEGHAGSPPVYAGSWVYSAGWDALSSIRVSDKNLHWRVGGDFGNAGPVAAGDTLYVPDTDHVHAFELAGGFGVGSFTVSAKRWSHSISSGGIQGLAVGDGALFVACEAHKDSHTSLVCLDPVE